MPVAATRDRHHHDSAATTQTALLRPPARSAHSPHRVSRVATGVGAQRDQHHDWQSVGPLVEHFNGEDERARATRSARRKAQRAHRPLHLSWPVGITAVLLLTHLVALLWLHGSALAARNRDAKIGEQIRQARSQIESTQKDIAALDSAARIAQWARDEGWREAVQADFDDVTKPAVMRWNVPAQDSGPAQNGRNAGQSRSRAPATARVEIEVQKEGEVR